MRKAEPEGGVRVIAAAVISGTPSASRAIVTGALSPCTVMRPSTCGSDERRYR